MALRPREHELDSQCAQLTVFPKQKSGGTAMDFCMAAAALGKAKAFIEQTQLYSEADLKAPACVPPACPPPVDTGPSLSWLVVCLS